MKIHWRLAEWLNSFVYCIAINFGFSKKTRHFSFTFSNFSFDNSQFSEPIPKRFTFAKVKLVGVKLKLIFLELSRCDHKLIRSSSFRYQHVLHNYSMMIQSFSRSCKIIPWVFFFFADWVFPKIGIPNLKL